MAWVVRKSFHAGIGRGSVMGRGGGKRVCEGKGKEGRKEGNPGRAMVVVGEQVGGKREGRIDGVDKKDKKDKIRKIR